LLTPEWEGRFLGGAIVGYHRDSTDSKGAWVMSLAELLPLVEGLSQSDRQQLMNFLAAQEGVELKQVFSTDVYPVWSPYDSFEAADLLAQMVKG
jgi:hypothetical protein